MKIYSIRDRLLNYFMQPFFGPTDNQVLASLAEVINSEESKHAFSKTPQHFEVWRLGEVLETGKVREDQEFLIDASGLVRPNLREAGIGGDHQGTRAAQGGPTAYRGTPRHTGAQDRTPADQAPSEGLQAGEIRQGSDGLSRQPNG